MAIIDSQVVHSYPPQQLAPLHLVEHFFQMSAYVNLEPKPKLIESIDIDKPWQNCNI